MEVKLIVIGGKANREYVTVELPAVIGRSREADLTVAHPMISRQHCRVYEVDGLLMIRDLGSLNGTVVQGRRVTEAAVRPEDQFAIGPLTFQVEYEYDGDLDLVPPPKLYDADAAEPEAGSDAEMPDFQIAGETPTFDFIGAPADQAAEDQVPDFSAWDQRVAEAEAQQQPKPPVDEVEDAGEFEIVEGDREEQEPEPTPPPPSSPPVDEDDPAKTVRDARVETVPDLFAAVDPGPSRPTPAKTEDEDLDEFFKGLQ